MNAGKVYLVGAGPGDPNLLTLKALTILQTVDVVLHDDLVTPEILSIIQTVRVETVGKRHGLKKISQDEINERMIALAREGRTVARLKAGDPLIFGRAGEEIEALRAARIEFEIVPGVTAASAAAATTKIPLTDRRVASNLFFVTGCHGGGHGLGTGQTIPSDATLVVYMPGADYAAVSRDLRAAGLHDSTPCLIASCTTRRDELVHRTTLGELAQTPPLAPPAVLIIGDVASLGAIPRPAFEQSCVVQ